ncbi:MBL fold metallo-hydrolase [Cytobacillus sp. FJAT-54145]|uniref:MBL fold metallo-hydrolase n=1 Tax=Cytobacillus spartinae TaxID=3299023 RepID=A0ABW6K5A5_9BACI
MTKIIPLPIETPFASGYVNAYVIIGKTVTLVDTGNPGKKSFEQLIFQLSKLDLKLSDLDHIVLTHMHTDHSGGMDLIQQEIRVPVYVHQLAKPLITNVKKEKKRIEDFFDDFVKLCGANPLKHQSRDKFLQGPWQDVHYLKDGDTVPLGGKPFKVEYVPGHSQTDLLLWDPETGDTLAGDHLMAELSVNAFIEPPIREGLDRPKPLLQYRKSLQKVRELPLKQMYPGHGKPFVNHTYFIDKKFSEQEKRCEYITNILSTGEKSIFEICQKLYPQLKGRAIFLGLSQIQGHLDLMETQQKVACREQLGINFYRLTK